MDFNKFRNDVMRRAGKLDERVGQAAFNHLVKVRPDLAEQVRGTNKDPFYVTDHKDPNWKAFWDFVKANWQE